MISVKGFTQCPAHNKVSVSKLLGFPGGLVIKNPPAKQETLVQSLVQEDLLEKEIATHSSILAWEISWTEEAGSCKGSLGSQKVGHDLATKQQ